VGAHWFVSRSLIRACGVQAVGRGGAWGSLRRRTATVLALCVAGVLSLSVCVAQAEPPKLIFYSRFSTGEEMGVGVAVDQPSGVDKTGDVYVASVVTHNLSGFGHVEKFDFAGQPLSSPSPFATGLDGGTAVNPTNGDVYVMGNAPTAIGTYDPGSGALVGTPFPVPSSGNFVGVTVVQIAADSAGNVYVPVAPQNEVLEYSPSGTLLNTFTGGSGAGELKGPTGVAVDSSGNLWVADAGNNRIEELSPAGAPLNTIESEGVGALALDGHGDVFAVVENNADPCGAVKSPCPHMVEYSAAGVQVADVGAGSFGSTTGGFVSPSMVAVNEVSGRVYVSDGSKGAVWIFGPPTAPVVGKELAAEVTTSEVKLGALVNPGGIPTTYRFEYGTSTAYGQSTPFPEGSVGEDLVARTVWGAASGLAPGTTYHYRVVATNELGASVGPDQTFTTETVAQAACSNDEARGGFSAKLPDCRAYELVVPPVVNSAQIRGVGNPAVDGDAIAFNTQEPLAGAPTGGNDYIATRGVGGWGSEDIIPLESYTGILCANQGSTASAYSADLSKAVIANDGLSRASSGTGPGNYECNAEGLQVVNGEPVGYGNLLIRDNRTGTYRLVNVPPPGVTPADAHFMGASSDLSHVFFTEMAPLVSGAQYGVENLFEWDEGVLRLVTATGSLAMEHQEEQAVGHPISTDGSHVLFTSGGGLYDRIDGDRTIQVDKKQSGATGSSGGGVLQTASTDGSSVLFLDESKLTAGSTAGSHEPDLYVCELVEEAGKTVCRLSDLTVAKAGEHADVMRVSELGSKDSSHVYFTAKGLLAANKREYEYTDAEGKTKKAVEEAKSGANNLYLEQDGTITFVATLSEGDYGTGAVSPDGSWLAFDSHVSLTGYDNISTSSGFPATEVFLYSAASGRLACASCAPSGEAPTLGGAELPNLGSRPLSDNGRLLFDTDEALVPSDTNGQIDVYEYEGGQPTLISSGTSSQKSTFAGASESGDDVFFESTQQLVPQDIEEDVQVAYDARANGGFVAFASPPACVTADACRSAASPQPSIYGAPSSQTFTGVGNLTPVESNTKKKVKPKKTSRACKHGRHKRVRCAAGARRARSKVKSHKGGK
jgi:hypothetical protein